MAKSRAQYIAEHGGDDISFSLVDEATVERRQREGEIYLPARKLDIPKDERWNAKQMNSKILQGILNGDSIPKIATSLMDVIGNNEAAAVRTARTMMTQAENAGRMDSYKSLAAQGVVQEKVWIATPDSRTRESHAKVDGEEIDIKEEFSNGLMYPADPDGEPSEVYNCRCSMRTHILGFRRADGSISYVDHDRDRTMHDDQMDEERRRRGIDRSINSGTVSQSRGIVRDYGTQFATVFGKDFYDAMCDRIDKCESDDMRKLWEGYQSQVGVAPNHSGRGYASRGIIHVDKAADAAGSSWKPKYQTTFHESGHAIDYIARKQANTSGMRFMYSSAYKDGAFPATIKSEVDAMVKAKDAELKALFKEHKGNYEWMHKNGFISDYSWMTYERTGQFFGGEPKYSKSFAYEALRKEITSHTGGGKALGDLSDILEGATNARLACGYGHGAAYWRDTNMGCNMGLATEAFAEMTSATIENGESLKVLKEYLPQSYSMYEEMIKELVKIGGF